MKEHNTDTIINFDTSATLSSGTSGYMLMGNADMTNSSWTSNLNVDQVTTKGLTVEGGASSLEFINPGAYIKMPGCKEKQTLVSNKKGELRCDDQKEWITFTLPQSDPFPKCKDGETIIFKETRHGNQIITTKECKEFTAMSLGMENWILIVLAIIVVSKVSLKAWFSMVKFFGRKVNKAVKEVEKEWENAE